LSGSSIIRQLSRFILSRIKIFSIESFIPIEARLFFEELLHPDSNRMINPKYFMLFMNIVFYSSQTKIQKTAYYSGFQNILIGVASAIDENCFFAIQRFCRGSGHGWNC
jgi:uncharacterized membrane protein